jgi:lipopolysaccharide export system permease protein
VLKEILSLLVNRQATLGLVLQAIGLLIPFVLAFALPMGMLTASLLVFGRFSADQELTAARANGVSLLALITPVLLLSVALSGVCAAVNLQIAQQCRTAYKELLFRLGSQRLGAVLTAGRFSTDFPGLLIYVGKIDGANLGDVLLSQLNRDQVVLRIRAQGGQLQLTPATQQMTLILTNVWGVGYNTNSGRWSPFTMEEWPLQITNASPAQIRKKPNYSDMTFAQLLAEKRQLERFSYLSKPVGKMEAAQLRAEARLLAQMKKDLVMPVTVQMHRQVAFSFACIGFTLVGIPLGIRAHRRETSVGFALAIVLVLVYYSFIILGQSLETRPELAPHLVLWLPNFIFQVIGAVMLWRVNRGV